MKKDELYGAPVERGEIVKIDLEGCRVKSFCRDGVISRPLKTANTETLFAGDKVYYFMFPDGNGMILGKI